MDVSLTVNGRETTLSVEPRQLLGQVLRDDCGIDVRLDCETSTCGSCTVLLDGDPVKSCAGLPRHDVVGRAVAALEDRSVLPCGECRPAMQVVVASLLQSAARCSTDDVARAMSGTVCRCTGYRSVVDAVVNAADDRSPG
jgi:aerobic-type carbon monoxide dehydrogenase small subunit (CoxS/CutS family)